MKKQFKDELHNDPRYKAALANIPINQQEMFEQIVLQFAEQFHTNILQKFAEHVRAATVGDK